ncbi:hypothetical protein Daesc_005806 [Daldinia eschscholtzii]|uniref:SRR1-like domain-containing protein n=1 Tax=Daldinia eschscholtzii TaxID=292717 RepID=A0AAX6MMT9_9PEZI
MPSNFHEPRSIYKRWPDEDLRLQREVIEKYESGVKLWTKQKLLAMEEMLAGASDRVHTSVYAGQGTFQFEKERGCPYRIEFHGYQELGFPSALRSNGLPYSSMTVGIRRLYDGRVAENLHTQNEMFARVEYAWNSNPIGVHFHTTFMRLPFPPYINKIVCIGLGNFVLRADFKRDPNMQLSLYRHLAVLAAVEVLYSRFGRQIQILAQDVNYSPDCAAFLFKKGFSIVGPYGAGGLAEIDDKTFVFSPNPDFCAKEVVADIARPAAMLWKQILTPEESERQTRFDKPTGFGDQIAAYWKCVTPMPTLPLCLVLPCPAVLSLMICMLTTVYMQL